MAMIPPVGAMYALNKEMDKEPPSQAQQETAALLARLEALEEKSQSRWHRVKRVAAWVGEALCVVGLTVAGVALLMVIVGIASYAGLLPELVP